NQVAVMQAANSNVAGFMFDEKVLYLTGAFGGSGVGPFVYLGSGYCFTRGVQNVLATYAAGWPTVNQLFTDWVTATGCQRGTTIMPGSSTNPGGYIYVDVNQQATQTTGTPRPSFNQVPGSVTPDG